MTLRQRKAKKSESKSRRSNGNMTANNQSNNGRRWILWVFALVIVISTIVVAVAVVVPAGSATANKVSPSETQDSSSQTKAQVVTKIGSFELLETVPHDAKAFTQGLVVLPADNGDNVLVYEGTGLYGESELRSVEISTGEVLEKSVLEDRFFGEGIAYYKDSATSSGRIVQLTWREQTGFVYEAATLSPLYNFTYNTTTTEGWGITWRQTKSPSSNSDCFVVSDGSAYLHTYSQSFEQISRIQVTIQQGTSSSRMPVKFLNELEWDPLTDTILANVWFENVLLRIDPDNGYVTTIYNLQSLYPQNQRPAQADVLNGIALVPNAPDQVWVTGKLWPKMFRIRLVD